MTGSESMYPEPPTVCESGVPETTIATLVDSYFRPPPEDPIWTHLFECARCAGSYAEFCAIRVLEFEVDAGAEGEPVRPPVVDVEPVSSTRELPHPVERPAPPRLAWPARVGVAAALLVGLAGLAVGAAAYFRKPAFVGSSVEGSGRVSDFTLRSNVDFQAAGISSESRVEATLSFVVPPNGMGTAMLIREYPSRQLNLVAFSNTGVPLWKASSLWKDYADLLGFEEVDVRNFKNLVTEAKDGHHEESLALVLLRRERSCLLLVDPLTGERRASVVHDGPWSRDQWDQETVVLLPRKVPADRTLLLSGQHHDPRTQERYPCVTVVDTSGHVLQHVRLPSLGLLERLDVCANWLRVDWSPDRPEVTIESNEDLMVSLLIRDGQLDLGTTLALATDSFIRTYGERKGPGALDRAAEERGGMTNYLRWLASDVKEQPVPFPAGWRGK